MLRENWFDVAVVGSGPAGIAAALHISNRSDLRALMIDAGRAHVRRPCPVDRMKTCTGCGGICNVISGFGGAIHYGDGVKLSKFPSGRRLQRLLGSNAEVLMAEALEILDPQKALRFRGVDEALYRGKLPLKNYEVTYLTSEEVRRLVDGLYLHLTAKPYLKIRLKTEARRIEPHENGYLIETFDGKEARWFGARNLIIAVGRRGHRWWRDEVRKLGLAFHEPTSSVGVRFECPRELLEGGAEIHPDFKTTVFVNDVKVKTFCFCSGAEGGRIKFEDFGDYTLLDGHASSEPGSSLANFALLAQLRDAQGSPLDLQWIEDNLIAKYRALRQDRPGKPVLQWYPDFKKKVMSSVSMRDFVSKAGFTPSVLDLELAPLHAILPENVHSAFCAVFEELLEVFLSSKRQERGSELNRVGVLGLELEGLWDEIVLDEAMETTAPRLFACGDCGGHAQGIVQAVASGLAAAHRIVNLPSA